MGASSASLPETPPGAHRLPRGTGAGLLALPGLHTPLSDSAHGGVWTQCEDWAPARPLLGPSHITSVIRRLLNTGLCGQYDSGSMLEKAVVLSTAHPQ